MSLRILFEGLMTNFIKIFFASFISLVLSFSVFADDDQPTFIPVEGFGCNYAPGKDMNDLMIVDEWNEYVDDSDAQYNAWIILLIFTAKKKS